MPLSRPLPDFYRPASSLTDFSRPGSTPFPSSRSSRADFLHPPPLFPLRLDYPREKGCILILGRNEDEDELKSSLLSFESMARPLSSLPAPLLSKLTPLPFSILSPVQRPLQIPILPPLRHTFQGFVPCVVTDGVARRSGDPYGTGDPRARLGDAGLDG